jgi:hypothetical protein
MPPKLDVYEGDDQGDENSDLIPEGLSVSDIWEENVPPVEEE